MKRSTSSELKRLLIRNAEEDSKTHPPNTSNMYADTLRNYTLRLKINKLSQVCSIRYNVISVLFNERQ